MMSIVAVIVVLIAFLFSLQRTVAMISTWLTLVGRLWKLRIILRRRRRNPVPLCGDAFCESAFFCLKSLEVHWPYTSSGNCGAVGISLYMYHDWYRLNNVA